MIIPSPSEKLDVPRVVTPNPSLRSIPPPVHPALHFGVSGSSLSPPAYEKSRKPLTTVTYTFWPQTEIQNSMILAPPIDISDSGPSYFISVKMNLFTPTSHITTVRRNSQDGEFVGDFEMGLSNSKKTSTVCLRGNEYQLGDILKTGYQPFRSNWTWKSPGPNKPVSLYWDDSAAHDVLTCFSSKDKTTGNILAWFRPPYHPRKHGQTAQMHRLEMSPQGHEFFEDILISALIIERLRTTP